MNRETKCSTAEILQTRHTGCDNKFPNRRLFQSSLIIPYTIGLRMFQLCFSRRSLKFEKKKYALASDRDQIMNQIQQTSG